MLRSIVMSSVALALFAASNATAEIVYAVVAAGGQTSTLLGTISIPDAQADAPSISAAETSQIEVSTDLGVGNTWMLGNLVTESEVSFDGPIGSDVLTPVSGTGFGGWSFDDPSLFNDTDPAQVQLFATGSWTVRSRPNNLILDSGTWKLVRVPLRYAVVAAGGQTSTLLGTISIPDAQADAPSISAAETSQIEVSTDLGVGNTWMLGNLVTESEISFDGPIGSAILTPVSGTGFGGWSFDDPSLFNDTDPAQVQLFATGSWTVRSRPNNLILDSGTWKLVRVPLRYAVVAAGGQTSTLLGTISIPDAQADAPSISAAETSQIEVSTDLGVGNTWMLGNLVTESEISFDGPIGSAILTPVSGTGFGGWSFDDPSLFNDTDPAQVQLFATGPWTVRSRPNNLILDSGTWKLVRVPEPGARLLALSALATISALACWRGRVRKPGARAFRGS